MRLLPVLLLIYTSCHMTFAAETVSPDRFDFVVVPPEENGDKTSEYASPIDQRVDARVQAAAARVSAAHPFRSFLLKTGGADGGDLYLVGVDRHGNSDKILFAFDGRNFVKIAERAQDVFPQLLIPKEDLSVATKAGQEDKKFDLAELERWKDEGFLKPQKPKGDSDKNDDDKEGDSGNKKHGLSELPATLDFEPELLADLAEDWPDHVRKNRTRREVEQNADRIVRYVYMGANGVIVVVGKEAMKKEHLYFPGKRSTTLLLMTGKIDSDVI